MLPPAFAFSERVIGDVQFVTFVVFGCFALLVMADFGGTWRARAFAYVASTLVGAVLVVLGTLVSPSVGVGAAVMFGVGLVLTFAVVFGGYVSAAHTGLLLAFVLAVSVPAPLSAIPTRAAGWLLAGLLSTLAGLFLWPRRERMMPKRLAADGCRAVAELVEALRRRHTAGNLAQLLEAARQALGAARREYAASAKRPAGPTRAERASVELLAELERIIDLVDRPFHDPSPSVRPCIEEGDRLTTAVVDALRASAAVLSGGAAPNLRAVDEARRVHREALDRWAAEQLRAGHPAEEVLDGLDVDHTLRVIAYVTMAVAGNVSIAAGGRPETGLTLPASIPRREGATGVAVRAGRTVRAHLEPTSSILHNSLRAAVGLTLSVLLARTLRLDHAFWVVLGTVQVLRSNALGTGQTTVQALAGSVIGFMVGGLFALVAGTNQLLMWAVLPLTVFLAAYAASAVGFLVSQSAFTLNLIIIFNLISPIGWRVGLMRIEDVAVGTAISVVVGILLWPRGARQQFARAASSFYRAAVAYVEQAFERVLGSPQTTDVDPLRRLAVRARDRASEAFDELLNERGAKPVEPQTAAFILSAGKQAMLAGDALTVIAVELGYQAGSCPEGARTTRTQARAVLVGLRRLADQLAGRADGSQAQEGVEAGSFRAGALDCLRRWRNEESAGRGAMAVVMAGEWVQNLARLEADLDQPVNTAVEAARIPWWR